LSVRGDRHQMSQTSSVENIVTPPSATRIGWVDYAKGICIILVVMMHTVDGIENSLSQTGWMREIVDFAKPFRMPDFFLISGLFLSRTINGPFWNYADRKLVHFIYFYLLWLTLQMGILDADVLLSNPIEWGVSWVKALIQPTNTLWFIHMLAIFYVVSRMLRKVPKLLVLIAAIALQTFYQFDLIDTGFSAIDRFANRFVYFWFGYMAAPWIFQFAKNVTDKVLLSVIFLMVWGVANYFFVEMGAHNMPVLSLALGAAGAIAICIVSASLEKANWLSFLRYTGQHSIAVYLGFVFPLAICRRFADQLLGVVPSVGWLCAIVLTIIVAMTLIAREVALRIGFSWLYQRPKLAQNIDAYLPMRFRTGLAKSGL